MKYALCRYNNKKELMNVRRFSCQGCAKKRAKAGLPYCVRKGSENGEIVWKNKEFKELFR